MTDIITEWSRVEEDGSGDYYIVPEGLFNISLEEAFYTDPDFQTKANRLVYVGGHSKCFKFKGEIVID